MTLLAAMLPVLDSAHLGTYRVAETATVDFHLQLGASVRAVSLAGSFNGWNKDANPMKGSTDGKTWDLQMKLPYGLHQYKFVINGDQWTPDPNAKSVDDGNGNVNSVLTVLPPDYLENAAPGDRKLTKSGLGHEPKELARSYDQGKLSFRLRTRVNDAAAASVVVSGKTYPMAPGGQDDLYAYWVGTAPWNRRSDINYSFRIDGQPFGKYKLSAKDFKPFTVPTWPQRAVVYQIFPDRFANGDKSNDPADVQPWDAKPTWFNRFGGDAVGVAAKASYLKDLGVTTIYFNPVFKSPSNHRYEADDFKLIDPQFGTNDDFAKMAKSLAKADISLVMDYAFNHSSPGFAPFRDIIEKGEQSQYRDWYFIKSYPVTVKDNPPYEAWYGFPSMPKLNVMNPETTTYLDGVFPFWKRMAPNLKGVRLDVGNEVDMRFWRTFRPAVKNIASDTWIVGEVWGDGNPWLQGDQWDSVMNYPFRDALVNYFALKKGSVVDLMNRIEANRLSYPPQVQRNLMNFLSTHDTARFLTLAKGDQKAQKLAATILFTWTGAPSVYYGEELGMEGGTDPDNRRGMRWDLVHDENDMLKFYRRLIQLRRANRAITDGDTQVLRADSGTATAVFRRTHQNESVWVAINASDVAVTVPLAGAVPKTWADQISGQPLRRTGSVTEISLRPHSAAIVAKPVPLPSARRNSAATSFLSNSLTLN